MTTQAMPRRFHCLGCGQSHSTMQDAARCVWAHATACRLVAVPQRPDPRSEFDQEPE